MWVTFQLSVGDFRSLFSDVQIRDEGERILIHKTTGHNVCAPRSNRFNNFFLDAKIDDENRPISICSILAIFGHFFAAFRFVMKAKEY